MDSLNIWSVVGFCVAGYAIVANDAIQTLGTFLASNARRPWWVLWLYGGGILSVVLVYGWWANGGDVSYGRLEAIPSAGQVTWLHCIPPLVLLLLTRYGFPVSTTFLVLTFFAPSRLDDMLFKSLVGYVVAFAVAFLTYRYLATRIEKRFFEDAPRPAGGKWVVVQWLTTGFLWSQWLIQDLANIYVYVGHTISAPMLGVSLVVLLALQAYTFYVFGGAIQKIVTSKFNTADIRSASLIDLQFGLILLVFKEWSNMPMSTTWVFLGVLAGREIALSMLFKVREPRETNLMLGGDLAKAGSGLLVSVMLALALPWASKRLTPQQAAVGVEALSSNEQALEGATTPKPRDR